MLGLISHEVRFLVFQFVGLAVISALRHCAWSRPNQFRISLLDLLTHNSNRGR